MTSTTTTPTTPTTPTVTEWADAHRRVDGPLRSALDRLDPTTRHVCGYHLGYWDADASPTHTQTAGKRVRATLALLSAAAAGAGDDIGIPAAMACELLHNFSLLHDDIMDGDTQRRHRTTAWAQFGMPVALLAGDVLSSLASEVLAEAPSPTTAWAVRCLTATTRRLIAGQVADMSFETREQVSLAECLRMAEDKTGALMACAASLGAVLADAPAELALGLADFGTRLGLSFQLNDDLLGIWGEPERTGKPVLSDLRSRKKSVPVVYALESGTAAAARLRSLYMRPESMTDAELAEAAELIVDAGGRSWTERRAEEELDLALTTLDSLDIPDAIAHEFAQLGRRLSGRDH